MVTIKYRKPFSSPTIVNLPLLLFLTFTIMGDVVAASGKTATQIGKEIEHDANGLKGKIEAETEVKTAVGLNTDLQTAIDTATQHIETASKEIHDKLKTNEDQQAIQYALNKLKTAVDEAKETINTVDTDPADTTKNTELKEAIEKSNQQLDAFHNTHKAQLETLIKTTPNSSGSGNGPITKEIEEAKTQITEMKEKALGDIKQDSTNKKEIAEKQIKQIEELVKGIRTRVEASPTGAEKTEMEAALADLISKKHMGGAIEELKVAGELMEETPAAAQAEEKVPPKPESEDDENEDNNGKIGQLPTDDELDAYGTPSVIERKKMCYDEMETSKCRAKFSLCKNKAYFFLMKQKCHRTCAHCVPIDFECKDRYAPDCQSWGPDFCSSKFYSKGMILMHCAKSCRLCV